MPRWFTCPQTVTHPISDATRSRTHDLSIVSLAPSYRSTSKPLSCVGCDENRALIPLRSAGLWLHGFAMNTSKLRP